MLFRNIVMGLSAFAVAASPAFAEVSVAQSASAAKLSVARSSTASLQRVRAGAKRGSESKILGLPILAVVLAAAAVTAVVVVATDDSSDSP